MNGFIKGLREVLMIVVIIAGVAMILRGNLPEEKIVLREDTGAISLAVSKVLVKTGAVKVYNVKDYFVLKTGDLGVAMPKKKMILMPFTKGWYRYRI